MRAYVLPNAPNRSRPQNSPRGLMVKASTALDECLNRVLFRQRVVRVDSCEGLDRHAGVDWMGSKPKAWRLAGKTSGEEQLS